MKSPPHPESRASSNPGPRPSPDESWNRPLFRDRGDAGRRLAEKLEVLELHDPLVLGLPRGGVVTAAALARALDADMDVTLSRKLRAPHQPELAIGAVGEDGDIYLDERVAAALGVDDDYIAREREERLKEATRRRDAYREVRPQAPIKGRTVIVTDDGVATGSTMIAGLDVVRSQEPGELIAAIPVAPGGRLDVVRQHCDRLICLHAAETFRAVGEFYQEFDQVEEEQVVALLREFAGDDR